MTATSAQPGAARPSGRARPGRFERLLRARPGDPAWARPALAGLLAATALLYLAGLSRNGWANDFYAAAVQAGTRSWRAFLFGSVDSSNFITVDKPAGFLWPMELSARVFGLNSWSLLVPQALAGVATVGVLYTTVRRWFGAPAGLIAGAVAALTPAATLMFRFDNPDAALTLVITLSAYAITRAIESGHTRWVALAGAFVGLGFLTKMLAAFLVVPGFALAYLWAGPPKLGKRAWQLLVGGAALAAAAGWWVAIVLLTPASARPYVGGSTDNNILNLTFSYNGLGRLTGGEASFGGAPGEGAGGELSRNLPGAGQGFPGAGGGGGVGGMFGGATGITRLAQSEFGGQVAWLLPAALLALAALIWLSWRAPRADRTRAAALVWGGWLLVTGLVFSYMSGIIHPYYTIALAPAIGALVGIGSVATWRARRAWLSRAVMVTGFVITAAWAWSLLGRSPAWLPWLRVAIVVAGAAAVAMILAERALRSAAGWRGIVAVAAPVPLALIAGLGGPLAYSVETATTTQTGSIPSAGPAVAGSFGGSAFTPGGSAFTPGGSAFTPGGGAFTPGGGALPPGGEFPGAASGLPSASGFPGGTAGRGPAGAGGGPNGAGGQAGANAALSKLLEAGAPGYRWAAATISSTSAASIELASHGVPVMAIGGFSGSDPAPTLAEFEEIVAKHGVHYFVNGGGPGGPGGFGGSSQITSWVAAHFTSKAVGGATVYDLTSPRASASG
jgi:4-amino-4-deoxy-L-arabinose transferase-like glycosyltransferase